MKFRYLDPQSDGYDESKLRLLKHAAPQCRKV